MTDSRIFIWARLLLLTSSLVFAAGGFSDLPIITKGWKPNKFSIYDKEGQVFYSSGTVNYDTRGFTRPILLHPDTHHPQNYHAHIARNEKLLNGGKLRDVEAMTRILQGDAAKVQAMQHISRDKGVVNDPDGRRLYCHSSLGATESEDIWRSGQAATLIYDVDQRKYIFVAPQGASTSRT